MPSSCAHTSTVQAVNDQPSAAEIADRLARVLYRVAGLESVRTLEGVAASLCNRAKELTRPDATGKVHFATRSAALANLFEPRTAANDDHAAGRGLAADPRFIVCLRVAMRAITGALDDPTGGATACHSVDNTPNWAKARMPSACIGRFLFYRDAA